MHSNAVLSFSWSAASDDRVQALLTAAVAVLSLLWLFLLIKKWTSRAPPLPPGPRGLPIVGNLLSLDPELHTYLARLAKSYGPIYRLKMGMKTCIVVTSPAVAKEILKDQDSTFAYRDVPVVAKESSYGAVDVAWSAYGPEWRMLRKVCVQEMFSCKTLDSVYILRRREVRKAVKHFYSRAESPVNIGEQIFLIVMNVITSMLWGNTVKNEDEANVGAEFKEVVGEMTALMGTPNLSDFFPVLERFDIQRIRKKMKELVRRFDIIFDSMIVQSVKTSRDSSGNGGKESKDFLQFLLQLTDDTDSKPPFTMTHLKALLMDMVVGGTDTSSNTIEFALAEMMNNPQVLKKAQQELDMVVGRDNIVEEIHINKLPYLYSVMKETLRIHPILPLLVPHSPNENCIVSGYTVPKGARVFINVWAVHRDPSIWENPMLFNPDRFMEGKWDFNGKDFNYFPFGSGRRICAGILMAERTVMYSLASLVHSFEWSLPSGQKVDLSENFGIVMKKKLPLVAIPTPRLLNSSLYE